MTPLKGFEKLHFVGIGGSGMGPLAEILAGNGFAVTGSDREESDMTRRLRGLGVAVATGHSAAALPDSDAVIHSLAVSEDNPEIAAAKKRGIPVATRADCLGELMKKYWTLAVCGTHGKSTATWMLAGVWVAAGKDPTVAAGAPLLGGISGARLGRGGLLIAEADEYRRAFGRMHPAWVLLNNVDRDHLDYFTGPEDIQSAFFEFCGRVPFFGRVVANVDDAGVRKLLPRLRDRVRVITFGFDTRADYAGALLEQGSEGCVFAVRRGDTALGAIRLRVPGRHNAVNALGASAFAHALGIGWGAIRGGLGDFPGVHRRLDRLGEARGITFFDDYAHHPTAIRAVLESLRQFHRGRIVALFQPHLYSRTRDFADAFAEALRGADCVWITRVYAGRERPLPGVEGDDIVRRLQALGHPACRFVAGEGDWKSLEQSLKAGDVVIAMGAGDITKKIRGLWEVLSQS